MSLKRRLGEDGSATMAAGSGEKAVACCYDDFILNVLAVAEISCYHRVEREQ